MVIRCNKSKTKVCGAVPRGVRPIQDEDPAKKRARTNQAEGRHARKWVAEHYTRHRDHAIAEGRVPDDDVDFTCTVRNGESSAITVSSLLCIYAEDAEE